MGAIGVALFAIPSLTGLIEAPLFARAERAPRRWLVGSLLVMAFACFLGAVVSGWPLAVALAIYAPASGISCALAQSDLVMRSGGNTERAMARWTLAGGVGDLLTLPLLSLAAFGSLGIQAAFAVCGVIALVQAAALRRLPLVLAPPEPEDAPPLSVALRNRRLVVWTLGIACCSLLDEIVIAFGAMHFEEALGAGVHARTMILGSWMVGGLVGLVALERLAGRAPPARLLAATAAAAAVVYVAWILATSIPASVVLAFLAGVCAGPLYPLAVTCAYAVIPDRPAAVNALASFFSPLEWAVFPIAIGLAGEWIGLTMAMLVLALEPLVLGVVAYRETRAPRERDPG